MKTHKEYEKDAIQLIKNSRYTSLLKDTDAIGEIMTTLMLADHSFDGRGSIRGWRVLNAKRQLIKIIKRNNRHKHIELTENIPFNESDFIDIEDVLDEMIPDRAIAVYEKVFMKSTFKEIGDKLNISTQAAKNKYDRGLEDFQRLWNR